MSDDATKCWVKDGLCTSACKAYREGKIGSCQIIDSLVVIATTLKTAQRWLEHHEPPKVG